MPEHDRNFHPTNLFLQVVKQQIRPDEVMIHQAKPTVPVCKPILIAKDKTKLCRSQWISAFAVRNERRWFEK